jgi:HEPN domain-containing protein
MEDFQTTPFGLWTRAKQFAEAARVVADAAGNQFSVPAYYLWGHSIELSLKAFLYDCGVCLPKLKKLGHDLKALVEEAKRHNLEKKVYLDARELGEICCLNDEYTTKHFEYHETEIYYLPYQERTQRIAEKFVLLLGHNLKKTTDG